MATTEPIRNKKELRKFINYYKKVEQSKRNYTLICMGLNTALRIGDILNLKWTDVYEFSRGEMRGHIELEEDKTEKYRKIIINPPLKEALQDYYAERCPKEDEYIFIGRKDKTKPITRIQAYRIITKAAQASLKDPRHISCHSLRKTFGYQAWKDGVPLVVIMQALNHSSYEITKKYLGINQDELDKIFLQLKY